MSIAIDLAVALQPGTLMRSCGLDPDPWQLDLLQCESRQILLLCTRQAGKSTATAALAARKAVLNSNSLVLLVSPCLRQTQELFSKAQQFARQSGFECKRLSAHRIELSNGSRIVSLPGDERTIRGYSGVNLLVIDEAARVDDALYYSVRPMLAVSEGRIVALSTPFGRRGWFYDTWQAGGDTWKRVRVTAHECPRISKSFLRSELAAVGEWWFKQEYLCEFVDSMDQVFRTDDIETAISQDVVPINVAPNSRFEWNETAK